MLALIVIQRFTPIGIQLLAVAVLIHVCCELDFFLILPSDSTFYSVFSLGFSVSESISEETKKRHVRVGKSPRIKDEQRTHTFQ